MSAPLLEARGLRKHFPVRGGLRLRRDKQFVFQERARDRSASRVPGMLRRFTLNAGESGTGGGGSGTCKVSTGAKIAARF